MSAAVSTGAVSKSEPKMESDKNPPPTNAGGGGGVGSANSRMQERGGDNNRGPKRKRGGPPFGGPGRNSFANRSEGVHGGGGGRGGGFGGGGRSGGQDHQMANFERGSGRPNFQGSMDNFDGPQLKKLKIQGPDARVHDKLMALQGPSADLAPKRYELKKFLANTRLYIGNIANEVTEAELKELFQEFGEIDETFMNREKNFAFLKLDYRTNAERARAELDQKQVKGRPIKVRFAPSTVRIRVKNLAPMVSNELLEVAFSVFGDIEKAMVFVDDKGKSTGEGFVDYTRKNNAMLAHKYCTDKCYFLTSDLRPVITEMGDMCEVDEGLLEMNLNRREFNKNRENEYYKSREVGPRIAESGSFEADYGEKYKTLLKEFKEKELLLKEEMQKEIDKLQTQMELARYDYETEMLRQQLRQREIDQERHKMEWEGRMQQRVPRNFAQQGSGPGFNNNGRGDNSESLKSEMPSLDEVNGGVNPDFMDGRSNNMPLIPPPMPPQGLMAHLQGGEGPPGPTWEYGYTTVRNSHSPIPVYHEQLEIPRIVRLRARNLPLLVSPCIQSRDLVDDFLEDYNLENQCDVPTPRNPYVNFNRNYYEDEIREVEFNSYRGLLEYPKPERFQVSEPNVRFRPDFNYFSHRPYDYDCVDVDKISSYCKGTAHPDENEDNRPVLRTKLRPVMKRPPPTHMLN